MYTILYPEIISRLREPQATTAAQDHTVIPEAAAAPTDHLQPSLRPAEDLVSATHQSRGLAAYAATGFSRPGARLWQALRLGRARVG